MALAISLLGMAPGPFVTGLIADVSDLKTAMAVMPVASLLAGLCFLAANRHFARDAAVFHVLPESSLQTLEEELIQLDSQAFSDSDDASKGTPTK